MSQTVASNAYLDCFSGISGDMLLGALLDAGLPFDLLTETLKGVDLEGYRLAAQATSRDSAIAATQFHVTLSGHHPPRDWRTIYALLTESRLSSSVKSRAIAIFQTLAAAEAKVHGCEIEEVHFHEVGAVDSIIDIVGAAVGLDYFSIKGLTCSPLPMGRGWVRSCHGALPLPAPAVCELIKGVPVYGVDVEMELVTPTGAAIVKTCAQGFGPLPAMTIATVGYGAGSKKRPDGQANLLRLVIGEARAVLECQEVMVMETNLDDWSPETYPFLSERLFAGGALDVALMPIQMKKGRPGFTIQVIAPPAQAFDLRRTLLSETSAIGVRFRREERQTLPRRLGTVSTRFGTVMVKLIEMPEAVRMTPEYEDCRRAALAHGVSMAEVYRAVMAQSLDSFQPRQGGNDLPER